MNKEEILYNEIYERTKDFGRTHFIKEIMRLQREIKELKDRIDKALKYNETYGEYNVLSYELDEILKGDKEC